MEHGGDSQGRIWFEVVMAYCQSTTLHTEFCASLMVSNPLQSFAAYSDTLCIGLHRLCDAALPLVSVPLHMPSLCLFICLFIFVPQCHT